MTQETLELLAKDPKAVLNRGYRAAERIAWRQERIEQWEQIATSITANPENGGGGPKGYVESKIEKAVISIITLQEEIKAEILEIAGYEHDTREIIKLYVPNPNHKAILELRYCNQCSWEEIAARLHYTLDWVQKLHKQALEELKEYVKSILGS